MSSFFKHSVHFLKADSGVKIIVFTHKTSDVIAVLVWTGAEQQLYRKSKFGQYLVLRELDFVILIVWVGLCNCLCVINITEMNNHSKVFSYVYCVL